MLFDVSEAVAFLTSRVPVQPPPQLGPAEVPLAELTRSPVAGRVGELAAADGLQLFHFEHRVHMDLPEDWVPAHDPELAKAPSWQGCVLPEAKYQGFRLEQAIGGFHPGMRAKWGAHELCHALVGTAWRPGASPLFLATAARLSELLPVVLWYALDEVHLGRCERHQRAGSTFRRMCVDCERVAAAKIVDDVAVQRLTEGLNYLERELVAVEHTRRLGRPVPHIYGSLDLCSDGVAYAAAHGPRLRSHVFDVYAQLFMIEDGGAVSTLDALQDRVCEVARGMVLGTPVRPLAPSAQHGRCRWILQDVAWRLLALAHETHGEVHRDVMGMVECLAEAHVRTTEAQIAPDVVLSAAQEALQTAVSGYQSLFDAFELPAPDDLFAVGYDLLGVHSGRSVRQVTDGLHSGLPVTCALLAEHLDPLAAEFVAQDTSSRQPLGLRFSAWMHLRVPEHLASLVAYEAGLCHLGPGDSDLVGLGGQGEGGYRLAKDVVLLRTPVHVVDLARSVDFGDLLLLDDLQVIDVDGQPVAAEAHSVLLVRGVDGQPSVVDVDEVTADALQGQDPFLPGADPAVVHALVEHHVLAPMRWTAED